MKIIGAVLAVLWMVSNANAQQQSPPPFVSIVIEQQDIQSLNAMTSEYMPPKFSNMIFRWLQDIADRQAKEAAAKAAIKVPQ